MPASGAELLVSVLEDAGVEVVFGLPGVHNLTAWEALRESQIRLIGVRHEQAAVYAADGLARATGRLGVALVTTGPGAANTLAATGEAWASGSSVLVIATDIPTTLRRPGAYGGALHECTDQAAMFAPVTKARFAWPRVDEALAAALEQPRAPVYLEIPTDLLAAPAPEAETRARAVRGETGTQASSGNCERPLVWAGGGARDRGDEVVAIAEALGAPILTSFAGRGIAGRHPLAVGLPAQVPEAGALWDQADLVIVIGGDLDAINTQNFRQPQPPRVIAIGLTPVSGYRIDEHVGSLEVGGRRDPWVDLAALRKAALARLRRAHPAEITFLDAFAQALPPDAIVSADMCIPGYWIAALHPFARPRELLYPMGWGTLGFGLPASIGPAAAGRRVVSVNGDGGLLFNAGELATIAEHELPVTIVVVDDGGYGMLRFDQLKAGRQPFGVDLHRPDFAALGEAFAIPSVTVDDFGDEFVAALNVTPPNLVVVAAALAPPPTTSPRWYRTGSPVWATA